MMIAVLLAGGTGHRFSSEKPKQFSLLNGKPLLEYSLDVMLSLKIFEHTVLVINKAFEIEYDEILKKYRQKIVKVSGGKTRQLSVYNALLYVETHYPITDEDLVIVHDCARPFSENVFKNVIRALAEENAVIPVVPVVDTLYRFEGDSVKEIPQRDHFAKVQTPQGFNFLKLLDCHKKAYGEKNVSYSDDGSLYMEYSNDKLTITEGDQMNFKITKAVDMDIAQFILRSNQL